MCKRYGRHSVISPVNTSDVWYKYTEYLFWVYFYPTVKFTLCSIFCSPSSKLNTPLQFNSSPLKNDGWKTILSFLGPGNFSWAKTVDLLGSIHPHQACRQLLPQSLANVAHDVPTGAGLPKSDAESERQMPWKAMGDEAVWEVGENYSVDRWINAKQLLRKDLSP